MKLSAVAQNPLEWLALKAKLVPEPMAFSHFGFMLSKFLLEALAKNIFETIGHRKVSIQYIADACALNTRALESLLNVLATMDLLHRKNDVVYLSSSAKKWILKDSPQSLYWLMMFDYNVCLKWMDYTGEFLRTGKGLSYHDTFTETEWFYYQKAMEAAAAVTSKEAVNKIPVHSSATTLLDIGGAHGLYSVALCKKYAGLQATILDLPAAVEKAKDILLQYNMGSRVQHRPGNILMDDIGEAQYDNILMASVAHHFTQQENEAVAAKVYRALKPGGYFTIIEVLRPEQNINPTNMLSALGDLFFALSSTSGLWSLSEIKNWQTAAGFRAHRKRSFLTIPGYTAISAQRPL